MNLRAELRLLFLCTFSFLVSGMPVAAQSAPAAQAEGKSDLQFVVLLSRHGVRSPLLKNEEMAKYAAEPWPKWEVPE